MEWSAAAKLGFGAALLIGAKAAGAAPTQSLASCSQVSQAAERLACFDALAKEDAETNADRQRKQFGLTENQKAPEDRKEAEEVEATVVSTSGSRIRLDNDMTWQVVDNVQALGWVRSGQKVTITRGVFSGYRMKVDGVNGMMVVTRVD